MGKLMRRTITISITETWTIVWTGAPDDGEKSDEAEADNFFTKLALPEQIAPDASALEPPDPAAEPASALDGEVISDPPDRNKSHVNRRFTPKPRQQRHKKRSKRGKGQSPPTQQANTNP